MNCSPINELSSPDAWLFVNLTQIVQDRAANCSPHTSQGISNVTSYGNDTWEFCMHYEEETHEVITSHNFFLHFAIIFTVIGILGNIMSIFVFSSLEMRMQSSNVFLLLLAVSDFSYLLIVFVAKILPVWKCFYAPEVLLDIANHSTICCILFQYLQDLLANYSVCLILAFTIERWFAVYMPMKVKDICTVGKVRYVCCAIFLVICMTIAPYHFMMIGLHSQYEVCIVLYAYELAFTIIYLIESLVYKVIPVFVIAVLNVFIIVKVFQASSERKKLQACSKKVKHRHRHGRRYSKKDERSTSMQLTIMLVAVSSSHILFHLPVLIHFGLWQLQRLNIISIPVDGDVIAHNYTRAMYIFGVALNFFLYTMSGAVYRKQLKKILCRNMFMKMVSRHQRRGSMYTYSEYEFSQTIQAETTMSDHEAETLSSCLSSRHTSALNQNSK